MSTLDTLIVFLTAMMGGWLIGQMVTHLQEHGIWCRVFGHRWRTIRELVRWCPTCGKRETYQRKGWK